MATEKKHLSLREFFSAQQLSWLQVGSISAAIFLTLTAFYLSPYYAWLGNNVTSKWHFAMRDMVGKAPKLDERIKIISFDNNTVNALEKHDLRLRDWAAVIEKIADHEPASIFIDKAWGLPIGKNFDKPISAKEGAAFSNKIQKLKMPVVVGSTYVPNSIVADKGNRSTKHLRSRVLEFNRSEHKLANFLPPYAAKSLVAWLPIEKTTTPLGPHRFLQDAFHKIGHIDYSNQFGYIKPIVRYGPQGIIPHASLLTSNDLEISEGGIAINGKPIPLNRYNEIYANFSAPQEYFDKTDNLLKMMIFLNRGKRLDINGREIEKGDHVVILPLMYTGNVDFVETPVGKIQGGYLMTSMINSVLTGNWIKFQPLSLGIISLLAACLMGGMLGAISKAGAFWTWQFSIVGFIVCSGFYQFIYRAYITNWMLTSVSFAFTGLTVFIWRHQQADRQARKLREALEGSIPPDKIEKVLKNPEKFSIDPCETEITVMFIDIVGFSISAEKQSPEAVFARLKQQLEDFTEIIHQHGGIIDKNLGDGILCFFGYDYLGKGATPDHADAALYCAIELQERSLQQTIAAQEGGDPVHPIRIGINTDTAFLGDIGDSRRIDFTLIGHGVNFAARLEGACEPFMIMMGPNTKDVLRTLPADHPALHKRAVQIKHHDKLFEAFEYNAFYDRNRMLMEALASYRRQFNISRKDDRFDVADKGSLIVNFGDGEGTVLNVSSTGYAVELEHYLAKGVLKTIRIVAKDEAVNDRLRELRIMPLTVEVCWGGFNSKSGKYLHGLQIKTLNDEQQQLLLDSYLELLDTDEGDFSMAS